MWVAAYHRLAHEQCAVQAGEAARPQPVGKENSRYCYWRGRCTRSSRQQEPARTGARSPRWTEGRADARPKTVANEATRNSTQGRRSEIQEKRLASACSWPVSGMMTTRRFCSSDFTNSIWLGCGRFAFARFPSSISRSNIMKGLESLVAALNAEGLPIRVWVDGSFTTEKLNPRDVDVLVRVTDHDLTNATDRQKQTLQVGSRDRPGAVPQLRCIRGFRIPGGSQTRAVGRVAKGLLASAIRL